MTTCRAASEWEIVRNSNGQEDLSATVARLRPQLYARALFLTQRREAADDLVQDVCERALRAGERFEPGSKLAAWLNCIMRNLFIDEYRGRRRLVFTAELDRVAIGSPEDQPCTPYDVLSRDDVLDCLESLGEHDRQVLELALVHNQSYRQIAAGLGLCVRTVGSRIHRAKRRLRGQLLLLADQKIDTLTSAEARLGLRQMSERPAATELRPPERGA